MLLFPSTMGWKPLPNPSVAKLLSRKPMKSGHCGPDSHLREVLYIKDYFLGLERTVYIQHKFLNVHIKMLLFINVVLSGITGNSVGM